MENALGVCSISEEPVQEQELDQISNEVSAAKDEQEISHKSEEQSNNEEVTTENEAVKSVIPDTHDVQETNDIIIPMPEPRTVSPISEVSILLTLNVNWEGDTLFASMYFASVVLYLVAVGAGCYGGTNRLLCILAGLIDINRLEDKHL